MAKNKDPAVMFYTSDFLVGVQGLTMEERGQYITLLCLQHQQGHLSDKQITLAVGNPSSDVIDKFDVDADGLYYHHRMEEEIEKRENFIATKQKNGSKGGRPKIMEKPIGKPTGKPIGKPIGKPTENLLENENITKDIINTKAINESNSLPIFPFSNTTTTTTSYPSYTEREAPLKDVIGSDKFKFVLEIQKAFAEYSGYDHFVSDPEAFIAYNEARKWRGVGNENILDPEILPRYIFKWEQREREKLKSRGVELPTDDW